MTATAPPIARLLLALLAIGFGIHALQYPRIFEDAFISYRYADNWVRGDGLVFNRGETVEGYTSFLWVVVLALVRLVATDLQTIAPWLSLAAGIALIVVTHALATRLVGSSWAGLAAAALVAAHGSLAMYAVTGMESTLFALLITAALYVAVGVGSGYALAALLVLAAMCRPEGVGYALVLLGVYAWRAPRRTAAKAALCWLAVYGGYFLWRYAHYGYVFPNTYYAKVGGTAAHLRFGVGYVEGFLWLHLGALGVAGAIVATARKQPWGPGLLGLILFGLAATAWVGGDIFPLFRFLLPITPAVCVATIALLWWPTATLTTTPRAVVRTACTGIAVLVLLIAPHARRPVLAGTAPSAGTDWSKAQRNARITGGYERIAAWLRQTFPTDLVVAINAAGVIPYRTRMPAIDMLGLNDEHIAHQPRPYKAGPVALGHEKHDAAYVMARRPDIVFVGLPFVTHTPPAMARLQRIWSGMLLPGDKQLLSSIEFGRHYQVVVVQIDAAGFTAFFLRRDRLPLLKRGAPTR